MIERILHSAGMITLCHRSLLDGTAHPGKPCFLLASVGILNLVVSLDPLAPLLLPPTNMIDPKGGTFVVPNNSKRFFTIPMGLWKEFQLIAQSYSKDVFKTSQKLMDSQVWAKSELQSMLKEFSLEKFNPEESKGELSLHFLPDGFHILNVFSRAGGSFRLPNGHQILMHMNERNDSWEGTIFLAVGVADPQLSSSSLYTVLMLRSQRMNNYCVVIGYFVSQNEAITTSSLVSAEEKSVLPTIEAMYRTREITDMLLPKLLQQRGFASIEALFFWLKRVLV